MAAYSIELNRHIDKLHWDTLNGAGAQEKGIMRLTRGIHRILVGGLAALAVVTAAVAPVAAQSAQSGQKVERIALSPASNSLKIDAGKSADGTFEVINTGDIAFDFKVYASPYGVQGESYTPDFSGKFPNSDAYKWVTLGETEGSLQPGAKKSISYTLNVPTSAAPGGHYGVIFAETKAKSVDQTGISRQKRVGHILFTTVNGSIQQGGSVASFELPSWQGGLPIASKVRVKNTGNVNFDTKVSTVFKDVFGRTKYKYTGEGAVLPDTTRLFDMSWQHGPNFGLFNVTQSATFLGQENVHKGMVLVAPRWFLILAVLIILSGVGYAVLRWRKRHA
jgi:hypothetical protein